MTNCEKVKAFMEAFGHDTPDAYTLPTLEQRDLRFRLMEEEHSEVVEAMVYGDKEQIAKEICDLLYVVYGTAISYGIDIDKCFDEVHSSNMSKLGSDGKPKYREDGKILKGENYREADLTGMV